MQTVEQQGTLPSQNIPPWRQQLPPVQRCPDGHWFPHEPQCR